MRATTGKAHKIGACGRDLPGDGRPSRSGRIVQADRGDRSERAGSCRRIGAGKAPPRSTVTRPRWRVGPRSRWHPASIARQAPIHRHPASMARRTAIPLAPGLDRPPRADPPSPGRNGASGPPAPSPGLDGSAGPDPPSPPRAPTRARHPKRHIPRRPRPFPRSRKGGDPADRAGGSGRPHRTGRGLQAD